MESDDLTRKIQRMPDVMMPDDLAVRGVEKRDAKPSEIERIIGQTEGAPFCLGEHVLWAESEPLCLNDVENNTPRRERNQRAFLGWILLNSTSVIAAQTFFSSYGTTFQQLAREDLSLSSGFFFRSKP